MIIYPTIELHNGKCVSLTRGRLDEPFIWHVDPVETARGFAAAGAEWMHLTDINALAGDGNNNDLLEKIIRSAGIPVQLGGGFRSREVVETWIDKGAGRIVHRHDGVAGSRSGQGTGQAASRSDRSGN